MAISTIAITAKSNGNLVSQTTGDNKIYQGAVNTTQYELTLEGMTLLSTDSVYFCFTRPDNVVGRMKMTYTSGTKATLLSNGAETDVDISNSNILKISFLIQRFNLSGGIIFSRPTGQLEQVIYESEGWTPQDISAEAESLLTARVTALEANKWGRYDVSADMLEYLPVEVDFAVDGIKTINNFYFNSEHTIDTEDLTGLLAVYAEDYTDENNYTQCEIFYNDGSIYTRTITIVSGAVGVVGAWAENVAVKIATALADYYTKTEIDANTYTQTQADSLLDNKVDKVTGKQLSTEDYTTAEKSLITALSTTAGATNVIATTPAGMSGENVQELIEELKDICDDIVSDGIGEGTLSIDLIEDFDIEVKKVINNNDIKLKNKLKKFIAKTWTGLTSFHGAYIWTDGTHIYYSDSTTQYVLNIATSTWSEKTWTGLTSFYGNYIWTDGIDIYYSNSTTQYVLDTSTSTWSEKTWTGLTDFSGKYVWTDSIYIYYSSGEDQYVLDTSTSTWSEKTWTGLISFVGDDVWTDGTNIYFSSFTNHFILDTSTSEWSAKEWTGLESFSGNDIWTDGTSIYYSYTTTQYVLDILTSTWREKTWLEFTPSYSNDIWTDGVNIYYSSTTNQYFISTLSIKPSIRG